MKLSLSGKRSFILMFLQVQLYYVHRCDWLMQVGGSTTDRIRSARLHLNDACWRSKTKDKMFSVQPLIVATLLTQLVLVVESGGTENQQLLNEKVAEAVLMKKAHVSTLGQTPTVLIISGVVLTLNDSRKLWIHKLPGQETMVEDAAKMGSDWKVMESRNCQVDVTVADFVNASVTGYNDILKECPKKTLLSMIKTSKQK
ncbi:unnamed protein product [Arctogadus glacialis]